MEVTEQAMVVGTMRALQGSLEALSLKQLQHSASSLALLCVARQSQVHQLQLL